METAYTFDDVMFLPRKSDIRSRSEIDLTTQIGALDLKLPIISANMADITEANMAANMYELGGLGILHRFMTVPENEDMYRKAFQTISDWGDPNPYGIGVSVGVSEGDKVRARRLYQTGARTFCIDVAHGHHVLVEDMIKYLKDNFEDINLIAGNVATGEGAWDLHQWGADVIKVGVGPGCFVAGTTVTTSEGEKTIEDVEEGDMVLTHRGRYKKVLDCISRPEKEKLYCINDIKCTDNHEFYVLNKKYSGIVTDDNIDEYAEWIRADELTKDYLLLEIQQ